MLRKPIQLMILLALGAVSAPGGAADAPPDSPQEAGSPIPKVDPANPPKGLTEEQFAEIMKMEAPLTPDQIREVRKTRDDMSRAAAERARPMPKPVFTSVSLGFEPGAVAHPVRTDINTVTSMVFTDSSGAPWPIAWAEVGDTRQFDLLKSKDTTEKKSVNVMTVTPKTSYGVTNLTVMLEDAPAPIVMTLLAGQKEVDYRLDVVMRGRSPNAKVTTSSNVGSVNSDMMMILDGVPPASAKALTVAGGEAEAWKIGDRILLRTPMRILSPAPFSALSSAGGMQVFEVPEAPLILVMNGQKAVQLKISGY